jgi:tRNA pseudouridine13 synthase
MLNSIMNFELPYATDDLPGIGGALRATPEHFIVDEVALYAPQGDGQHLYVNLTKVGLTTKDVQVRLEQALKLPRDTVGFAGMKDKYARTTQTFSLPMGNRPPADDAAVASEIAAALPVTVNWTMRHRNKLRLGHLLGNRFQIVVSGLALAQDEALTRAQAIFAAIAQRGIPNYFGPQRLGVDGSNVRAGLEVLRGEAVRRDKWLRRFLISAYQSHLCNLYLARRLEIGAFDHLLAGDVAKKYATGGMFDVVDLAAEQPRYAAQEISFTAPLYGPKMWEASAAAGELEQAILAEAETTLDDFARVRVEGSRRMGRLLLQDVAAAPHAAGIVVTFFLPKAAFATTVLRELMKTDVSGYAAIDESDED